MIKPSPRWQYRCAILALVFYNAWVLGIIVNPQATLAGATTSELQVWGQPGALFFRMADVISGLLFLASAGIITRLDGNRKGRLLLTAGLASLGVSTILETFIALDCSSALDALCAQREQLGVLSWQHNFHIFESAVAYTLLFLLPTGGLLTVRQLSTKAAIRFKSWNWALIIFMVAWSVETVIRFSHHAANYGLEQRLFYAMFTLWFLQMLYCTKAGSESSPTASADPASQTDRSRRPS